MECIYSFFKFMLFIVPFIKTSPVQEASFFGGSYVSLPLQEARSTTEISLRLKTRRSDALLLLAAGTTDYCLVVLENGALRVRINLGAGESELSSPPRLRLDDLLWHDVRISREKAEVTLTIDKIHITSMVLPGRFHELNIHYGVFLGGMGEFKEVFLGLLDNYRGCMSQVTYNKIEVLREVQEDSESSDIFGVEWECSEEFEAPADVPISLVRPGAYVAFRDSYPRTGGSIAMEVKTQAQDALLMYNTGPPSRSDFVALEIYEGHARLALDTGNGAVDLNSTAYISDGLWHSLEAHFKPTYMELRVDDHTDEHPIHAGDNKFFDLSGYLFVGGVEVNKQARAVSQGAKNGDKSLQGCLRNVFVRDKPLSLSEARVSLGIKARCKWVFPCLKNPCVDGAKCFQEGTDAFKCHCDQEPCVKQEFSTGYKVYTKTTKPFDLEVLSLTPLDVLEGGNVHVTEDNLRIVLDLEKHGIKESGVLFHVITGPTRGHLEVKIVRHQEDNSFTLLDLRHDRVTYFHDSSETTEDSFVLELQLLTRSGFVLPPFLKSRHRFVLPVKVKGQNDPPSIQLPNGEVIRMPSGTAKKITPEIVKAIDSDSPPEELRISVLTLKDVDGGYIQNSESPGQPVYSFTQEEVNKGLISFVHKGRLDNEIALEVSDGVETSEIANLRVTVFNLQVYLVNNTGLVMTHGSKAIITPSNLSCTTNAPEHEVEIKFNITSLPEFGYIQRLRGNDRWQSVNQFSSRQLEKDKIRYIHMSKEPKTDEFHFKIFAAEKIFPTEYIFQISFVAVTVEVIRNSELLIDQIQESFISEGFLQSVTRPDPTEETKIIYSIISPPQYGSLFLSSGDLTRHKLLEKGSVFTQEDISKGRIKYKLHRKSYSVLHDSFQFKVSSEGRSSDIQIFNIRHTPPVADANIIVERLDVQEGSREKITDKSLYIEVKNIDNIIFNVTSPPRHGSIIIIDETLPVPERPNATYFTSKDLQSGLVFYQHDDSETTKDRFHFVAVAEDQELDFQYDGIMHFKINMINDNHPIRTMEKVLNVVTESERVITSNDLQYMDPDIDTPPSQIKYTRRKTPNGDFFYVEDRSEPVYIFTQEDIDKRQIIFHHSGPSYGKAVISVTDGQLSSTGILEIVASEPFIEIVNNSGIIVPRGQEVVITNYNLSVETNINAWGTDITFHVTKSPKYGTLYIQGHQGTQFSEFDLLSKNLKYKSKGDPSFRDEFRFQARIGDTATDGIFDIKIYPESYWEPLVVLNNASVKVEEGSRVTIDEAALKIMHPNIAPSDITYLIVQRPQNGYLEVDVGHKSSTDWYFRGDEDSTWYRTEVNTFDQALINEGRIRYVQTTTNVTSDHFVFDVTNGITSITNLVYNIQVIPKTISLLAGTLEVDEGSQTIVTSEVVTVLTEYYTDKIGQYFVVRQPDAGQIQLSSKPGKGIESFTALQLQQGLVLYVHDGSERLWDTFSVVAVSDIRQSAPATVNVTVKGVNDEAPSVVNNTGLLIWEGNRLPIKAANLAVVDPDTKPEDIRITMTNPTSGFIALLPNLTHPVSSVTQEDINKEKVYFIHTGGLSGTFRWKASDLLHSTESTVFPVTARDLHLILKHNKLLHVFPMAQQPLTPAVLLIHSSDYDPQRSIVYVIRKPPTLGQLLIEEAGGVLVPVDNFTQRNVNESRVFFEHTHPLSELFAKDTFTYDVESPFTEPLKNLVFHFEISVASPGGGGLERYLGLAPLIVAEGGQATVKADNLNLSAVSEYIESYPGATGKLIPSPKIFATVTSVPEHGLFTVNDKNLTEGQSVSVKDIEGSHLMYEHDHSDTLIDSLGFIVYLAGNGTSTDISLFSGSLNISITPVNDQPFTLITEEPVLHVVHHQTAFISNASLLTTDPDNLPSEIVYELVSAPDHGHLIFNDNYSVPMKYFSQKDVNDGHILYAHDGTNSSARFYFKVSDGSHTPKYTVFTIEVEPLTLELVNHSVIPLQQASSVVYLSSSQLSAVTNGNPNHIFYNVTQPPRFGNLFMNDQPIQNFGQVNVDNGEVFYKQTDLSESSDNFQVSLWTWDAIITGIEVQINVVALIKTKPLIALVGGHTSLSLEHLDASQLAESTGSNPRYKIKRRPRFGKIKKFSNRVRRSGRSHEVQEFTHEEIRAGHIYYVTRNLNMQGERHLHDVLHYVVHVPSPRVQPAEGTLQLSVVESIEAGAVLENGAEPPRQLRPDLSPPNIFDNSDRSRSGIPGAIFGISADYVIVIVALITAVILVISAIFVVKYARRRHHAGINRDTKRKAGFASSPILSLDSRPKSIMTDEMTELECRPTELLSSPRSRRHMHHNGSSKSLGLAAHLANTETSWDKDTSREVATEDPQYKVTTLCSDPPPREPPDVSHLSGYPYGTDAQNSNPDLIDKPKPRTTNPMLRKNQYWV